MKTFFTVLQMVKTGTYCSVFELLNDWQILGHFLYIETDYEYD